MINQMLRQVSVVRDRIKKTVGILNMFIWVWLFCHIIWFLKKHSWICGWGRCLTQKPWAQLTVMSGQMRVILDSPGFLSPLLSLPITQTPGSSMTRGLCLDLAGWLFLPAEETSLRTQTHVLTLVQKWVLFLRHIQKTCLNKTARY